MAAHFMWKCGTPIHLLANFSKKNNVGRGQWATGRGWGGGRRWGEEGARERRRVLRES